MIGVNWSALAKDTAARWVAAGILALVIMLAIAFCRPKPAPIPAKDQTTGDSLTATKPDFQRRVDTLVKHETTYVAKAAAATHVTIVSSKAADSLAKVVDSLSRVAIAHDDTASAWHHVADAESGEIVQLRIARDSAVSGGTSEHAARLAADARADEFSKRLATSTDLNARLAKDVQAGDRCRVLLLFGCPSRTMSLIGGAVLGAVAGYEVARK